MLLEMAFASGATLEETRPTSCGRASIQSSACRPPHESAAAACLASKRILITCREIPRSAGQRNWQRPHSQHASITSAYLSAEILSPSPNSRCSSSNKSGNTGQNSLHRLHEIHCRVFLVYSSPKRATRGWDSSLLIGVREGLIMKNALAHRTGSSGGASRDQSEFSPAAMSWREASSSSGSLFSRSCRSYITGSWLRMSQVNTPP